jgi:hypothetical protein
MYNKEQLEFIHKALTAQGIAVPCANNGQVARLFIATLDETTALLKDYELTKADTLEPA